MWKEAIQITVACVLAIQMGLVGAVGKLIRYEFRILSCPKCLVWWVSMVVHLVHTHQILPSVFVSFLSSYSALWLCLLYDAIATLYNYVYGKIEGQEEDAPEDQPGPDEVSEMR